MRWPSVNLSGLLRAWISNATSEILKKSDSSIKVAQRVKQSWKSEAETPKHRTRRKCRGEEMNPQTQSAREANNRQINKNNTKIASLPFVFFLLGFTWKNTLKSNKSTETDVEIWAPIFNTHKMIALIKANLLQHFKYAFFSSDVCVCWLRRRWQRCCERCAVNIKTCLQISRGFLCSSFSHPSCRLGPCLRGGAN